MTGKARVYGLMALQEKAAIAAATADLREVVRQKDAAEALLARLTEALGRQGGGTGIRLATEVMAERAMAAQLMAEAERQRDKAAELAARLAEERARLVLREKRQQKLLDEAEIARREAAAERQARRDAMLPPRRR